MNVLENIKDAILLNDEAQKERIIAEMGDFLEYGNLDRNEVIDSVNLLLSHVVLEKDGALKESIFHAINNALVYRDVAADVSLDLLLPYYSSFKKEYLSYVLSFFGFSGKRKYLSILKTFLNNSDKELQDTAKEAISELEFRSTDKE